jgi:hypothetical protein
MLTLVIIVSIACITTMGTSLGTIVVFAILAYLKEKAVLKHKIIMKFSSLLMTKIIIQKTKNAPFAK